MSAPSRKAVTDAAEIVERILSTMPSERTATAAEREAYLRGAIRAWRIATEAQVKGA